MPAGELSLGVAMWLIQWWVNPDRVDGTAMPCLRGHEECTVCRGYYCIDEAFEVIAKYRRETYGISAPATPSGSIKAT